MKKIIKLISVLSFSLSLVAYFGIKIYLDYRVSVINIDQFLYWIIAMHWLLFILSYNLKSKTNFIFSMLLYIVAVFINLVGLAQQAEFIFKISFVGFIFSFVTSSFESLKYKKNV